MRTDKILKATILLNVALLVIADYRFVRKGGVPDTSRKSSLAPEPAATPIKSSLADYRFQWSMVHSEDVKTYIANLRAIRCPEATIKDIITAAVEKSYALKQSEARAKVNNVTTLADILNNLQREESLLLASLWHPSALPKLAMDSSTDHPRALTLEVKPDDAGETVLVMPVNAAMPVALLDPPADMDWSDEQQEALDNLREGFLQVIGTGERDASDPEYLLRWRNAQIAYDGLLRTKFGFGVYNRLHLEASRQAEEQTEE